ncbi:MAG: exo-alpha-sialidase [Acidobacteria bacterium]|nr:exo-alpha-sialidase [Acidobacteriota bacterium]
MTANTIAIGTVKGLFIFDRNGGEWSCRVPQFNGQSVFAVQFIGDALWAAPFTEWTGQMLCRSEDRGRTWETLEHPLKFPEHTGAALAKIWQITSHGDRLFAGVEPSALFTSDDNGASWQLCEGLWNHPHREQWQPGFGGLCLHTVLPIDEQNWVVATSTGGCYKTADGGRSWQASNRHIVAPFMPEGELEFGQCVHKIAYHPSNPDRLFLQHHWGVYRSDDCGGDWLNICKDKLPTDFGFACVVNGPNRVFILPIKADVERVFPEGKMRVYRSDDAGETWTALAKGLPQKDVYDCVLRDSMAATESGAVAFGTTGGSVYFSDDNGDSWTCLGNHLPRITCLRIGEE